ncbi:MAG: signal peptidase I [Puniceicoccales bacterium]|jgi:signal peptidase I|nr:signal peptidase I [Puniceicoccales bacterium]
MGPIARYRHWKAKRRLRKRVRSVLRTLRLVIKFRSDLIETHYLEELRNAELHLSGKTSKPTVEAVERCHLLLVRVGGNIFPIHRQTENAELLFAASVLAMAIRTFFLQPFSIPTNSMWPTYCGMVAELSTAMDRTPQSNIMHGITPYDLISPISGTVRIPINDAADSLRQKSILPYVNCKKWRFKILPIRLRRYELFVDDAPVPIEVPVEFDMERLLVKKFFPLVDSGRISDVLSVHGAEFHRGRKFLSTEKHVDESTTFLSFELIHGDVVLVNKLTTHFFAPRRGDAVVFATRSVPALRPMDCYYIKRLTAKGEDSICVRDKKLYVNNRLANFSPPMICNNTATKPYGGYVSGGILESQMPIVVRKGHSFVMGDNSAHSYDSRYFGPIPNGAIVGKPILHIYPFMPSGEIKNERELLRKKYFLHHIVHLWDRMAQLD